MERTYPCSKIWLVETRWEFQFQYRSRGFRDAWYGVRSPHFARIAFEVTLACRQTIIRVHLQCIFLVASRAGWTSDPIQSQCKPFTIFALISYRSIRILFLITGVTPLAHREFNLGEGGWKVNDVSHISAVAKLGLVASRTENVNFKKINIINWTSWLHRASTILNPLLLPTDAHNVKKRRVIKTF